MTCKGRLHCCGILEMADLCHSETAEEMIRDFRHTCSAPYIIFSDRGSLTHANKLIELITSKGLGTLVSPEATINRNSGNLLKVWIWTVDQTKLNALTRSLRRPSSADFDNTPF